MPSRKYAIEPDGEKRLEIRWNGLYPKNGYHAYLDNSNIGEIQKEDFHHGKEFNPESGHEIHIMPFSIFWFDISINQTNLRKIKHVKKEAKNSALIFLATGLLVVLLGIFGNINPFFLLTPGLILIISAALVWRKNYFGLLIGWFTLGLALIFTDIFELLNDAQGSKFNIIFHSLLFALLVFNSWKTIKQLNKKN